MGKNEMTETPIPEQVTKLTEYVRGCVKLIEGGTLNNIGVLNQEACIGQNGSSIVAALDALIKDNTDLKASVTLFRKCYKAAAEIWRKDNPERSEFFYPSGEKAIAAMIAEHSFWEKGSMTEFAQRNMELKERIAELEAEAVERHAFIASLLVSTVRLEAALCAFAPNNIKPGRWARPIHPIGCGGYPEWECIHCKVRADEWQQIVHGSDCPVVLAGALLPKEACDYGTLTLAEQFATGHA